MAASTHWGRVTYMRVCKLSSISSHNGLPPARRQAIIRTNVVVLLIGTVGGGGGGWGVGGANFSEVFIVLKKMHSKLSSGKCPLFWPSLNVLTVFICIIIIEIITMMIIITTLMNDDNNYLYWRLLFDVQWYMDPINYSKENRRQLQRTYTCTFPAFYQWLTIHMQCIM